MEEFKKYITIKKCDETYKLMFVDFNDKSFSPELINIDGELNQTDKSKVKDLILEKIVKLSNIQEDEKFSIKKSLEGITDDLTRTRKISTKIFLGSNYIAANGRIGPANTILISEENYNKYNISEFDFENSKNDPDKMTYDIIFEDSIKDIILYRKNTIEQPGLVLLYSDDKYEVIETGFYPQKFYLKLEL